MFRETVQLAGDEFAFAQSCTHIIRHTPARDLVEMAA